MNPRQRLLAALRGDTADRVPLQLAGFLFQSREQLQQCADPRRREVADRIFSETAFQWGVPAYLNRYLVTPPQRIDGDVEELADGNRRIIQTIDTPKGELVAVRQHDVKSNTSWQEKYPVETEEEIEKIASVAWELPPNLSPPDLSNVPDGFEERGLCVTRISSPFVCVAGMMDYQWFLELALTRKDMILELTEICRRRTMSALEVLLSEPGIELVWMGGSEWVTPPMASPELYDLYVQEQERSIIRYVHDNSDAVVHVHCHGRVRHALKRTIERGGDYTEPVEPPPDGDITMAEAKEMAAGRITLGGNIECRILCNEDEAATEQAVRAAFGGGKERFILRPTEGPTPKMSDREFRNYMRLVDVWEELSPIE